MLAHVYPLRLASHASSSAWAHAQLRSKLGSRHGHNGHKAAMQCQEPETLHAGLHTGLFSASQACGKFAANVVSNAGGDEAASSGPCPWISVPPIGQQWQSQACESDDLYTGVGPETVTANGIHDREDRNLAGDDHGHKVTSHVNRSGFACPSELQNSFFAYCSSVTFLLPACALRHGCSRSAACLLVSNGNDVTKSALSDFLSSTVLLSSDCL